MPMIHAMVCETPDNERPSGGSSEFDSLFGAVVRSRQGGVVVYDRDGQPWDCDVHLEKAEIKNCRLGDILTLSDFVSLLPYVNGFWTNYWVFDRRDDIESEILEIEINDWLSTQYPERCSVSFINIDGAYWVVLAKEHAVLTQIGRSWHRSRRIDVQSVW